MRVTENTGFDTVRETIRRSKERMENLQSKYSTLKKLNTPSDDPVGSAKVLEMRTEKVNNDQFQFNGKMAENFLTNTDHVLSEISELMMRAKEIALSQSSSASANDDTRLSLAEEVTHLYNQAVSAANRRIGDRFLFGGYKTDKAPVDPDGRYMGDGGHMMAEISKDVFLAINVPGIEAFNTNPKASFDSRESYTKMGGRKPAGAAVELQASAGDKINGENVNAFDELQNLRIGLLTGDTDGIRSTLDRFDDIHAKIVATRAKVGSRLMGLQTTGQAIERHNIVNAQLSSTLEDADMAQVVSDLAKEETVYRSALQSSQKLIQPTLMEFLK